MAPAEVHRKPTWREASVLPAAGAASDARAVGVGAAERVVQREDIRRASRPGPFVVGRIQQEVSVVGALGPGVLDRRVHLARQRRATAAA